MSELALQLIHENIKKHQRGEDARSLDLGNCGLTEVPIEIGQCTWLEELVFTDSSQHWNGEKWIEWQSQNAGEKNAISLLPDSFAKLKNLKRLDVNDQIPHLSTLNNISIIAELANLEELYCGTTKILDLSPLIKLFNLRVLSCYSTSVTDLSPIARLYNLQLLNCSNTLVADLSPLAELTDLKILLCSSTKISDLYPLTQLTKLQTLSCFSSQISDLIPLSDLINLQELGLGITKISDLMPLSRLINLQKLYCLATQISDLTPLSSLTKLQKFDCTATQVHDLSPLLPMIRHGIPVNNVEQLFDQRGISAWNCPLVIPPLEIATESPQAVRDYFEELGHDGRKLNEIKIIFLGEASSGKTSLVKRLMQEDFNPDENQTHGIRIRKMPFTMSDGDTVNAHLWDFGGQEVMHATHQLFLSQRCIYMLLLNSRNDDRAEKWLKHAASFGGHSPVLVVLNKIDENPSFDVNRKSLREKYPQILDFYRVSCQSGEGVNELFQALCSKIDNSITRRTPFPAHWLAVKNYFANEMKADYIESAHYRQICINNGVSRPFSQDVLLQFLHDLGVIINFRNLKNFDTHILNPLWLTNGIYRIINSKIVGENTKGLLYENDFDAVINDPRYNNKDMSEIQFQYPKNKLHYIVRIMQEFELCFMLNAQTYVIPQLLPVQEPEVDMGGSVLHFIIDFPDFLPDSFFPRLMVKLHDFIAGEQRWRTGMVLYKPIVFDAQGRIRWDKEDQKFLIDVCGKERRRLLSFIRETIKEIANSFTNLTYRELVPIPGCVDTEDYDYLIEAEKADEKEIFVKALKKRIAIADLLDGIEEPTMRDEISQLPVKAFVSYAHKDLEYLKELRSALAPLIRLQKLELWDDHAINAGDDWNEVIFQQLEAADIVLCLISSDFVDSDFCYRKEFETALTSHRKDEKTIVPVMLRMTDWQDLPLSAIQGTPGVWITSSSNRDEAWTKVSKALRSVLEQAQQRKHQRLRNQQMPLN